VLHDDAEDPLDAAHAVGGAAANLELMLFQDGVGVLEKRVPGDGD
jgi:hypothetical protein